MGKISEILLEKIRKLTDDQIQKGTRMPCENPFEECYSCACVQVIRERLASKNEREGK